MTAFGVVRKKLARGHANKHFIHVYKSHHLGVIEPAYLNVHSYVHFQRFET